MHIHTLFLFHFRIFTKTIGSMNNVGYACLKLTFWYHMYGRDISRLIVFSRESVTGYTQDLWWKDGEQGNAWYKQEIDISIPDTSKNVQVQ